MKVIYKRALVAAGVATMFVIGVIFGDCVPYQPPFLRALFFGTIAVLFAISCYPLSDEEERQ